jgi:hypothetical protein
LAQRRYTARCLTRRYETPWSWCEDLVEYMTNERNDKAISATDEPKTPVINERGFLIGPRPDGAGVVPTGEDEPTETAKDDKPNENKLTVPLNDPTLRCRMTNGPQLISSSVNLSQ